MLLQNRLLLERLFTSVAIPLLTFCALFEPVHISESAFGKDCFAIRGAAEELIWILSNFAVIQNTFHLFTLFNVEHIEIQAPHPLLAVNFEAFHGSYVCIAVYSIHEQVVQTFSHGRVVAVRQRLKGVGGLFTIAKRTQLHFLRWLFFNLLLNSESQRCAQLFRVCSTFNEEFALRLMKIKRD